MDRLKVLLVAAILAIAASAIAAEAAGAAKGGNSDNAKLCQKGGWEGVFRSDGSSFASQDACVSYAAQGGTLLGPFAGQAACAQLGGTFVAGGGPILLWRCNDYPPPAEGGSPPSLDAACLADGGLRLVFVDTGGDTDSTGCRAATT